MQNINQNIKNAINALDRIAFKKYIPEKTQIMLMLYFCGIPQAKIGTLLGISRERVRQLVCIYWKDKNYRYK